jgi:hypothetical protein
MVFVVAVVMAEDGKPDSALAPYVIVVILLGLARVSRYSWILGWSAMSWFPTKQAILSLVQRIDCRNGPHLDRDHSIPSMLMTFGIPLMRCSRLKIAVLYPNVRQMSR